MKAVCALLLFFVACRAAIAREVSIDELLKNAKPFDHQRVTVRGIAEDGGDKLFIYADRNSRTGIGVMRAFVAYFDSNLPPAIAGTRWGHYAYANDRWVKVTGIVDTRLKRWGDEPFGLRLETVEALGPRLRDLLEPLVYIRNDTGQEIQVEGTFASGGFTLPIRSHHHADETTEKGFRLSVTSAKRQIATFGPITSGQWKDYFDARKRAYYFRVTANKIDLVRPEEARMWPWDPDPERD